MTQSAPAQKASCARTSAAPPGAATATSSDAPSRRVTA